MIGFHYYYSFMATKKQKYYVVWQGHVPGIYDSWEACRQQVKNYPDARYKAFTTKKEAEEEYFAGAPSFYKKTPPAKRVQQKSGTKIIPDSISVDAACSGNPGRLEYRGVWTADSAELFHVGPLEDGTNNIGEFLAIVHALALLEKKKDGTTAIYSDSKTAMSWVNRKKANTKLERTHRNAELFKLIHRAQEWLRSHAWKNPILKWETDQWGEIPADFGRK
jgi:ribonuclease HI